MPGSAPHTMPFATLLARGVCTLAVLVSAGACAVSRPPIDRIARGEECEFVVTNRTGLALEIRRFREYSTVAIGAINPGELLTDSASCAEGRVEIAGVPIPMQVGAPVRFAFVRASADLVPGTRVDLPLHWP